MKFHNYFIYITTNPQRKVPYTWVTDDVNLRMEQHRQDSMGIQRTFAGKYHCYNLIYHKYYFDIRIAIARDYGMLNHLLSYPWVLPLQEYESPEQLMKNIIPAIIAPVEQKVLELKRNSKI